MPSTSPHWPPPPQPLVTLEASASLLRPPRDPHEVVARVLDLELDRPPCLRACVLIWKMGAGVPPCRLLQGREAAPSTPRGTGAQHLLGVGTPIGGTQCSGPRRRAGPRTLCAPCPLPRPSRTKDGQTSRAGCRLWALTANPCPAWPQWTGALGPGFKSDQGSDPALAGALGQVPLLLWPWFLLRPALQPWRWVCRSERAPPVHCTGSPSRKAGRHLAQAFGRGGGLLNGLYPLAQTQDSGQGLEGSACPPAGPSAQEHDLCAARGPPHTEGSSPGEALTGTSTGAERDTACCLWASGEGTRGRGAAGGGDR